MTDSRQKVLIAGGSSGMGLALARRCLDDGAQVTIVGRDAERLARACEQAGPAGAALRALAADISREEQVASL
ncbi:SDR family NAD(P)-dependent oxidoreductase [Achromobacter sp. DMS1]|uniref:SDR family NAD(P)-dependent oxidoreductase n=1 Tax=Achromobacter sp. DMS1 TaxID=1688405 RepID=UPI000B16F244|nr:SDR family NAD(P)-dependent oxidoreductase [Achromobacter sp. DMS1]